MKSKFFLLIIFTVILFTDVKFVFAQGCSGLNYEMVSYDSNSQSTGRTPLFDINIFGQQCFPIASKGDVANGNQYQNGFQFLFDLMIGVSIALAVIIFTFGAAQGIIEDTFNYKLNIPDKIEAKKRMENSLVGLLIILGSWLVINTINPDLLRLPVLQGLDQLQTRNTSGTGPSGVNIGPGLR